MADYAALRGRPVASERRWRYRSRNIPKRTRRSLGLILRWLVLLEFAYVFLYPVMFMVTTSFKTFAELNHPAVQWISRSPSLEMYRLAWRVIGYQDAVVISGVIAIASAVGQTLVGALVSYGFARIWFRGRRLLFGLLVFTAVVPLQTVMVPQFMLES